MGDVKRPVLYTARDGAQTWRVRYRHAGKESSQTFQERRDADRFCTWIDKHGTAGALEMLVATQSSNDDKGRTVATWCAEHIDTLTGVTRGTINRYRAYVRNDLGALADLPIDAVTEDHIARWIQSMQRAGASGKTVKNKHGFLSGAMKAAVKRHLAAANPCEGHRLPQTVKDAAVYLTHDEYGQFLGFFDPQWVPLVETLFGTGMRWGEITALQVRDFDGDARMIAITRAWKQTGGGREIGPPKSRKSRRTVRLAPETVTVLRMQCDGKGPKAWIFTDERGRPITGQAFHARAWGPAVSRAEAAFGKRPRIHDARHSYASWLLYDGVPINYVQAQLGHESITTTVDRYGHLMPGGDELIAHALSAALSASRPQLLP